MVATYPISVRSLGDDFEAVRAKASGLAASYDCQFWWMPEPNDWHRFVFDKHDVAILFVGFLKSHVLGDSVERIKYGWVSPGEVKLFAEHCAYIRSTFEYARRFFSESTDAERAAMKSVAPHFFENLDQIHAEFVISAACRVTDPWKDDFGNENFVVGLFTNAFVGIDPLHRLLTELQTRMETHRSRILKARHKLTAHSDRETIKAGKPLAAATWPEWDQFWRDLGTFVSLVHEHVLGSPFEIQMAIVRGEAEMVLKKMQV
jgi:hypothetical protein